jgi:RNA 2',3'-cyclic 3'-phosphodiesterase
VWQAPGHGRSVRGRGTMRLFVAVTPSAEAIAHLAAAVESVRGSNADLRWSRPENWHLTVTFLGDVTEDVAHSLDDRLARAARRHPACELAFRGAGRFDGRVLWVGVEGDMAPLRRLADSVTAAARRSKIAVEAKPFRPHVTLARARIPTDLRPLVAALQTYEGPVWEADRVSLVRSFLQEGPDGGSRYEVLTEHRLTGKSGRRLAS